MSAASTRRRSTPSAAQVGVQPAIAISPTTARVRRTRIMLPPYSSGANGRGRRPPSLARSRSNTQQFYNAALAIVAGVGAAALALRLLPPLSPALRTRRLLELTLRDLRRLTTGPIPRTAHDWEARTYGRLTAPPRQAGPVQRRQAAG